MKTLLLGTFQNCGTTKSRWQFFSGSCPLIAVPRSHAGERCSVNPADSGTRGYAGKVVFQRRPVLDPGLSLQWQEPAGLPRSAPLSDDLILQGGSRHHHMLWSLPDEGCRAGVWSFVYVWLWECCLSAQTILINKCDLSALCERLSFDTWWLEEELHVTETVVIFQYFYFVDAKNPQNHITTQKKCFYTDTSMQWNLK